MQVVVVVIDEMCGVFGVLDESLYGIFGEELSIGLGDPPEELCVELAGGRGSEEVHLAVEYIEDLVQALN